MRQAVGGFGPSRGLQMVALAFALCAVASLAAAADSSQPAAMVNINTAEVEELTTLPGIGPALAARIVEFREKNGPFESVDDLLKVQGIGEKSLERFRSLITAVAEGK